MKSQITPCVHPPLHFSWNISHCVCRKASLSSLLSLYCTCTIEAKIFLSAHTLHVFSHLFWTLHLHGNMQECHGNCRSSMRNHFCAPSFQAGVCIWEHGCKCLNNEGNGEMVVGVHTYFTHVLLFLWLGDKTFEAVTSFNDYLTAFFLPGPY